MQWLVTSAEDIAVLAEINRGASDRALGIIAASLVEIHLTKLIQDAFITETKIGQKQTVQELMFNSSGPLGPFSNKIRLAYLMGLVSADFFKELEIMKEIRNRFAHRTYGADSVNRFDWHQWHMHLPFRRHHDVFEKIGFDLDQSSRTAVGPCHGAYKSRSV
jgi:DNA-binding MltR family transcriptional regulator